MKHLFFFLLSVLAFVVLSSCSGSEQMVTEQVEHNTQTRYLSTTGSDFMRDEIKKGLESVQRLHVTISYKTYQFDLDDLPTHAELTDTDFSIRSVQSAVEHQSRAGSALILSNRRGKSVVLTAAHTVSFPDTVWHFAEEGGPQPEHRIEAVSVKESVSRILIGPHGLYEFELALSDPNRDLALLTQNWEASNRPQLTPLALSTGSSASLDWTDMVYAIGYPLGTEMVTRSMISKAGHTGRRGMVLDASFNRGFSGGAVFAVRGDGAGMEWVGMVSSASGEQVDYLIPERVQEEKFRPDLEYTGAIYARRTQQINYGITFAVGVDQIKEFYRENSTELEQLGITIRALE